jgi:hypothetical protein
LVNAVKVTRTVVFLALTSSRGLIGSIIVVKAISLFCMSRCFTHAHWLVEFSPKQKVHHGLPGKTLLIFMKKNSLSR